MLFNFFLKMMTIWFFQQKVREAGMLDVTWHRVTLTTRGGESPPLTPWDENIVGKTCEQMRVHRG